MNVSATKKQMSPLMQKRLAATKVGENAAKEVSKIKPKPGQTVTTKTNNDGSTSSKVTDSSSKGVPTKDTKFSTDKLLNKTRS